MMPKTITAGATGSDHVAPAPDARDDAATLIALEAAFVAFTAIGARVERAIAYLGGLLDRHAALPLDAWDEARALAARYLAYRYGPTPGGRASIAVLVAEGWGAAVACRVAYRRLSRAGQATAEARYGAFTDRQGSDNPLWLLGISQARLDALDARAHGMGIGRGVSR